MKMPEIFIGKQKVALIGEIDISVTEANKETSIWLRLSCGLSLVLTKSKIKKTSKFPHSTSRYQHCHR